MEQFGLPDFSNIAKGLPLPNTAVGLGANQVFKKDVGSLKLPKKKVLSSSVSIKMQAIVNNEIIELDIGELDNFKASKSLNIIMRHKPFGHKFEEIITEDTSWEISFGGKKVDWKAAYLFYINEVALAGVNSSNKPTVENTLGASQSIGIRPTFDIKESIKYHDGTIESYIYKGFVFTEYDLTIDGDNSEIPEEFSGIAKYRVPDETFKDRETSKITNSVGLILKAIQDNRSL